MSTTMTSSRTVMHERIHLDRWPSEIPLFAFAVLVALPI